MKAAVFLGPANLEIRELPVPEPQAGEVLIRVLGCGVCGTDAHIYRGEVANARPPVVLGHEIFGRIESCGPRVRDFGPGDQVVVDPFIPCGSCSFCRSGEPRFCSNETFIGYNRNGGFAQFVAVPASNAYALGSDARFEDGVLTETLSTVVAGLHKLAPPPGRTFLLLGAGAVGLLWNQLLRRSLSAALIQTELIPERLQRARELGADRVLSPREEDLEASVRTLCPEGVDYLIDATGSTEAVSQALPLLKKGGTFMCFGICPAEERLPLSLGWFYQRQLTFLTSRRPPREMGRAIRLLEQGAVEGRKLVTGRLPLERIEEAFRLFFEGKDRQLKMAIDPWAPASLRLGP
jgi:2-desacetyl-2-hydroxyethyl bacteriochlorophyllide A dehydrogenase